MLIFGRVAARRKEKNNANIHPRRLRKRSGKRMKPPLNASKSILNRSKIVRKRSQAGQEIQQSSSRRPGRTQEADFSAIPSHLKANLDPKIKQKTIIEFDDHPFDAKNV